MWFSEPPDTWIPTPSLPAQIILLPARLMLMLPCASCAEDCAKIPTPWEPDATTLPLRRILTVPELPAPPALPANQSSIRPPPPPRDWTSTPVERSPFTTISPVWLRLISPPLPELSVLKCTLTCDFAASLKTAPPPPPMDCNTNPWPTAPSV